MRTKNNKEIKRRIREHGGDKVLHEHGIVGDASVSGFKLFGSFAVTVKKRLYLTSV